MERDITFGDFIKRLRLSRDISLGQMERDIGLSKSYLSKLENNEKINLTMCSLAKISNYYKIDIGKFGIFFDCYSEENQLIDIKHMLLINNYLFAGKEAEKNIKNALINIIEIMENISDKQKNMRMQEVCILIEFDKIKKILMQ